MNMQSAFKFRFLFLALAVSLTLGACKDACTDVQCNNGSCSDGECICASGYSGVNCEISNNARFEGVFVASENCLVADSVTSYNITLAPKSGTPDEFTLQGLWQAPQNLVTAVLDDNGTSFTITRQGIVTGYEVEASVGTISADGRTVNLTYTIYETSGTTVIDQCTTTMQKP